MIAIEQTSRLTEAATCSNPITIPADHANEFRADTAAAVATKTADVKALS